MRRSHHRNRIKFCNKLNAIGLLIIAWTLLNCIASYAAEPSHLSLTENEKSWLIEHQIVRVRVSDTLPYSFTNPKPSGIAIDYLEAVAKKIGITLEYVKDNIGWSAALADVVGTRQYFDILLVINRSPERELDLALTKPYATSRLVVFGRRDSPLIKAQFTQCVGKLGNRGNLRASRNRLFPIRSLLGRVGTQAEGLAWTPIVLPESSGLF